jgi:hypothetical protein
LWNKARHTQSSESESSRYCDGAAAVHSLPSRRRDTPDIAEKYDSILKTIDEVNDIHEAAAHQIATHLALDNIICRARFECSLYSPFVNIVRNKATLRPTRSISNNYRASRVRRSISVPRMSQTILVILLGESFDVVSIQLETSPCPGNPLVESRHQC